MKRYLLLLSALLSTTTYAGFYVGAGVGPDYANINKNARVTHTSPEGVLEVNVIDTNQQSAVGVFGTLYAGYGQSFVRFLNIPAVVHLAGELNANLSSSEHKNRNEEYTHGNFALTKYRLEHAYGVSLLPGIYLNPITLFYGRLGYACGNFQIKTNDISLANMNRYLNGFRFGFGVSQDLSRHVSGRMEYSHVAYESTSTSTVTGVNKTTTYKPHTDEVEFSLLYNV